MFKKRLIVLGVIAIVACAIFIPPVRAAAESALSIFRVADTKTIRITVSDLQELMALAEDTEELEQRSEFGSALSQLLDKAEAEIKPISGIEDFTAFSFSLPTALKAETPELYAAGTQSQTITMDTAKFNAALTALGAATLVDNSLNGTVITVNTPPAVAAVYDNVMLAATQNIYIDASDDVMSNLWSAFLSIPAIPDDLHAQLSAINPKTRDVYLPVIEGLGRETDLGGTTGYIYSTGDLAQVLDMLPEFADDTDRQELQEASASALIWLKNGVLYYLTGTVAESELIQIARSIH